MLDNVNKQEIQIGKDPEENHPIIEWYNQKKYKLRCFERIGENPMELPGHYEFITLDDLITQDNVLIFGERGGGSSTFLRWFTDQLSSEHNEKAWIFFNGLKWSSEPSNFDTTAEYTKSHPGFGLNDNELNTAIQELERATSPADFHRSFEYFQKNSKNNIHFIFYEMSAMNPEARSALANGIRSFRDSQPEQRETSSLPPTNKLFITILNSSEAPLMDTLVSSGLWNMSKCFRLPRLDQKEILELLKHYFKAPTTIKAKDLREGVILEIMRNTGGQPHLVQLFLQRLIKIVGDKSSVTSINTDHTDLASSQLKRDPPRCSIFWKEELKAIISRDPELRLVMASYIQNQTLSRFRYPPHANERSLYISGWLDENTMGRWGISSQFHAQLAREVI